MNKTFFSILVPVYNVKEYLDECVESLLAQTYPDFEIVLVDDGSKDGSGDICDTWQARFPEKIRVVHQENQGLVMARSTGFKNARGMYFVIVDSDDCLHPQALAVIHQQITDFSADVVIFNYSKARDYSTVERPIRLPEGKVMSVGTDAVLREDLGSTFILNNLCTKAFRRDLAEIQRDFRPVSHISEGEDLMFSLPIMDRAERVVYCHRALYYYRPNQASITNTYKPGLFRSLRDTIRIQRGFAEKWDPTGVLAAACDKNALHLFYEILTRIAMSGLAFSQKRRYMNEVVTDEDFQRICPRVKEMEARRMRITLKLAGKGMFWPFCLYGYLKRNGMIRIQLEED